MFNKKECKSCGEEISKKYLYCPYCGNLSGEDLSKEDFGMLGEDDFEDEFENFHESLFNSAGGRVIGKMFESAMRILEKEIAKETKRNEQKPDSHTNFQLFINGKKVDDFGGRDVRQKVASRKKEIKSKDLPRNSLKKFSKLPKNEPKTNVRRFSDKVIYEINIPGVKSLKDISIVKLESNIEVKAISKDKAYSKMIPVNFPITDYNFSKGKLVIELDSKD